MMIYIIIVYIIGVFVSPLMLVLFNWRDKDLTCIFSFSWPVSVPVFLVGHLMGIYGTPSDIWNKYVDSLFKLFKKS